MAKPPQDVFTPDPGLVKPLVPRIEIALTVPDGVDIQITVNGVGVLMQDDDEAAAAIKDARQLHPPHFSGERPAADPGRAKYDFIQAEGEDPHAAGCPDGKVQACRRRLNRTSASSF
jgi:hypothetical protein